MHSGIFSDLTAMIIGQCVIVSSNEFASLKLFRPRKLEGYYSPRSLTSNTLLCLLLRILKPETRARILQIEAIWTVGNVQALGANGKAAFSPKAHG